MKSVIRFIIGEIRSFSYAFKGLWIGVKSQSHMRFHLLATVLVSLLGFYFDIAKSEWIALVFAMGFVLTTELINTAFEFFVDLISPEYHQTAGKVKDIAAAAVLLAAFTAITVGIFIFWPKFALLITA